MWILLGWGALVLGGALAGAAELRANAITLSGAPEWVRERDVERVVARVERELEWSIRRVKGLWVSDASAFARVHGTGASTILAFTRKSDQRVVFGPRVTREAFEGVLAHELAHVVTYQKYKESIPDWLSEGLANWLARKGTVDYRWLAGRPLPSVESLGHPFKTAGNDPKVLYQASSAVIDLLRARCRWRDLLQLSVGKKLETYIRTTCGIRDLNAELRAWILKQSAIR
ncbi:MAG: hypothetical protein IT285_11105 [Bdellovibrionales bacterium]|nr:hypothetical protein [Bdellovibrionales bacterium]